VGTLRDSRTNRPLAGGLVDLRSTEDSSQRHTPVDSVGGFAMTDLQPETYKILTRAIPYRRQERTVKVTAGRVDTMNIALAYYDCSGY
jgi:hypothetical protein